MEPVKYKLFKWNEHGVCTNPKIPISFRYKGSRKIFNVLTAECESGWSYSVEYELVNTGGGYLPRYGGTVTNEKECIVAGLKELHWRFRHNIDYNQDRSDKESARQMLRRVEELLAEHRQYELF